VSMCLSVCVCFNAKSMHSFLWTYIIMIIIIIIMMMTNNAFIFSFSLNNNLHICIHMILSFMHKVSIIGEHQR
jgi:hypothetical protein